MKKIPIKAALISTLLLSIFLLISQLTDSELDTQFNINENKDITKASPTEGIDKKQEITSDDASAPMKITETETEENIISQEDLKNKGINLENFTEDEIYVFRKFNSGLQIADSEMDDLFGVYLNMMFLQGGEKNPAGLLKDKADNNWIAGNAYNNSITHWKSIAENGDALAGATLGLFYESANRKKEATEYYKKVFVNITDPEIVMMKLIQLNKDDDPILSASYAFYFEESGFEIIKSKTLLKNIKKEFNREDMEENIRHIKEEFEEINLNIGNDKKITLKEFLG